MRRKEGIDVASLNQLRDKAYEVFLRGRSKGGMRFDRSNPIECRRAALILALNGNFPDAFELFNCYPPPKNQKRFFMRLITSARVALLPHEVKQSKGLDNFGFLLWRGYLDAARWLISGNRSGIGERADYSIRIYEKTGLPADLAKARLAVRRRREYSDLLFEAEALAQLTKDEIDIDFLRDLIDRNLQRMPIRRIEWLLRIYDYFRRQADLEAAIIAAEALNAKKAEYWWDTINDRVDCWRKIAKITRSIRVRNGLARARELQRLAAQEKEESDCQQKKRIFADAEWCINVVSNSRMICRDDNVGNPEYLARALELIEVLDSPERLRLLVRVTNTIDELLMKPHRWDY